MKKIIGLLSLIAFTTGGILLLSGCTNNATTKQDGDDKINVMVSILPQVEFVERIGGNKVSIQEMIPPGFSPETYDPSPEQLKKLQTANIYFRIGHIPFEKSQMGKLANINPKMEVVDTSTGITLQSLIEDNHEGDDPHIWLSPQLVKIQAQHIYDALVAYQPKDKDYFLANYNQFIHDLDALDSTLAKTFKPIEGKTIFVFHPAFGYLASAYNFHQEAIEVEGKDPSPDHLKKMIDKAKADNVHVIFVQKEFSTKSAEAIAKGINGVVIKIDPLAKDYFNNLKRMSDTIVEELQ